MALQSGRIGRRFRKQYADQVEIQALEVDLHFFLVAAVHLRRCIERAAGCIPELGLPLTARLRTFDIKLPSLLRLRNVSAHIDEYNLDSSKESSHTPACVSTTTVIDRENHGYRVAAASGMVAVISWQQDLAHSPGV